MPEQALGWLPLGLGLVVEDEPSELSCVCACVCAIEMLTGTCTYV